jgi:uncharacterized protein (UPF0261 family)
MIPKTIAVIGTFDTKGEEFRYLRERIQNAGLRVLMIDAGVLGSPPFEADISQAEVAAAASENLAVLRTEKDRGRSVTAMACGATAIVQLLYKEGTIHGAVSLGGSAGTAIATAAMRALPYGFPKLMVSTVASGDIRSYVGTKDICMMPAVLDIAGLNRISRLVLSNAAGAICGMVAAEPAGLSEKPVIAATMFGVTTPCVTAARRVLEEKGYEVLVFHATGVGGQAMEQLIEEGAIQGVLDITTTELADELVGGVMSAGPHRLEAAASKGIPQLVCPGAIDMVNFGPADTVPAKFRSRHLHCHNPSVTLMRTTSEECAEIGRITALKLNRAAGPVTVLIPLQGVSAIDKFGEAFYSQEAINSYRSALKAALSPTIKLVEFDAHINDETFARGAANLLMESVRDNKTRSLPHGISPS